MEAKVNLVENNPKHKFMNPKGKKFKKPSYFHSSPHANSSFFRLFILHPLNPKSLARRLMEDSAISAGEPTTWSPSASTERRN